MKAQVTLANAMKGLGDTLVDTAKVEVDYIKATGSDRSDFLEPPALKPQLGPGDSTPTPHNPFPVSRTHRLEG